jgi:hypothetical protein
VTPDEIRAINLPKSAQDEDWPLFKCVREIAAQLAEQNALTRADQETRRALAEEARINETKRNEILESSIGGMDAIRKTMTAPPQLIPVFRVPNPSDQPEHLGCFVLLPDGNYAMAIHDAQGGPPGMVVLEPEEAQRLIAILSKPSEGKPS